MATGGRVWTKTAPGGGATTQELRRAAAKAAAPGKHIRKEGFRFMAISFWNSVPQGVFSHMSCHVHCRKAHAAPEARHMRRFYEVRGLPARATSVGLLTVFLTALPASAGLVFVPVNTLPGADATALAGSGATLWAATPRGVWRLDAGAWTLDGLPARTISSIAVADAVYAADGENVWKREADGTWSAETLPGGLVFPSRLATDGAAVWAAGLGVAKRSSGAWALLANPGGLVTAAAVVFGDLVVGLRGGAARYAGAAVTPISTGLPAAATVQAFGVDANGTPYAGTDQSLYYFAGVWNAV